MEEAGQSLTESRAKCTVGQVPWPGVLGSVNVAVAEPKSLPVAKGQVKGAFPWRTCHFGCWAPSWPS